MTSLLVAGMVAAVAWLIWGERGQETPRPITDPTLGLSGPVRHMDLDGSRLAIHTGDGHAGEIVIYDLRTGLEERRVRIERGDGVTLDPASTN